MKKEIYYTKKDITFEEYQKLEKAAVEIVPLDRSVLLVMEDQTEIEIGL